MTETKRPCADCDNVEPCDILERCVKHDPTPLMFDNYTQLRVPDGTTIDPCPVCDADPEVWQYISKPGEAAQKVVMCSHSEEIGPHDSLSGGGCLLYMPPTSFYQPTIREAVKHWNDYGKALTELRKKNTWKRAVETLQGNQEQK